MPESVTKEPIITDCYEIILEYYFYDVNKKNISKCPHYILIPSLVEKGKFTFSIVGKFVQKKMYLKKT